MATSRRASRATQQPLPDADRSGDWEARLRLWIEIPDRGSLGPGKFKLLAAIDATHSLAAAARRLRMSYRLAWQHLRSIEQRAGLKVVERQRGGREGGGTRLTPEGRALLEAYSQFCANAQQHVDKLFGPAFASWKSGHAPGQRRGSVRRW